MMIADYELDSESDVTPSDLKAMRLRLGMSPDELAQLLGNGIKPTDVVNMEKGRTWIMREGHRDLLKAMEETFGRRLDDIILQDEEPEILIGFPNDGVFHDYEPELAAELQFNSVHRMLLAVAQDLLESTPPIVEIIPTRYAEWLAGRPDSFDERQRWAQEHMKVYRMKPGMPRDDEEG